MANLARFDPFTSLTRLDPFETMVRELMPTMFRSSAGGEQPAIPIEVQEMDNAYLVAAELPGVKKDAIDISITGNQVTISAEAKREMAADAKEWCNERCYGKLSRTIQLPIDIEEESADASYTDGVLRLTLPKKASSLPKRLEIH